MNKEQEQALLLPFKTDETRWRLRYVKDDNSRGWAVPYVDSRAIQNRLDNVLGRENWEDSLCVTPTGNPKDPIAVVCTISIYYADKDRWITKSDGASGTDIEPVKGGISDAFKRAASMWGCGRYMYQVGEVWVDVEVRGKTKLIAESSRDKLDKYYENAVAKIFKLKPAQQPGNAQPNPSIQTPPAQQKTAPDTPAPPPTVQGQKYYTVKSTSLSRGASGENTTVELIKPDKSVVTAYIKGDPGLKKGQKLSNVKATEKDHVAMGKYFIIDEYQVAA